MRRVLVCGGRGYSDVDVVFRVLNASHNVWGISAIISGMARGADTLAVRWAAEKDVELVSFPADWKKHGKSAGPIRNQQMLDEGKPDMVIAFPGGRGTDDMCKRARKADLIVLRIRGEEGLCRA